MVLVLGTMQGFFTKVYLCHQNKSLPDKDLASVLKVNPFFVKDYKAALKNYSEQKLEEIFYILEEYDLRSKGVHNGAMKEGELLKEMVSRVLN